MRRILVVDDEADVSGLFRQVFRSELEEGRLDLAFAHSGEEALASLAGTGDQPFDLVFSDINMPGMDGLDLLARIRAGYPGLPVSMISAYDDESYKEAARERGAAAYVTKPVDFESVRRVIDELTRRGGSEWPQP